MVQKYQKMAKESTSLNRKVSQRDDEITKVYSNNFNSLFFTPIFNTKYPEISYIFFFALKKRFKK